MRLQRVLLTITLLAVTCFVANAQTDGSYEQPARLKLRGMGEPKTDEGSNIMPESFYPIGWSADGKFAYYVEPPDEACGCYFGTLVIQDLKTDKILWEDKYNGGETSAPEKLETITEHWKTQQKLFSKKLAEFGIKPESKFSLDFPAFKYQKDLLTPKLVSLVKNDDGLYARGTLRITLSSKSKGRKTIYERKFDPKVVSGFLGAEIMGTLVSPYEARAAIVVVEKLRGYEGPPHTTRVRVVGATLTTGFR